MKTLEYKTDSYGRGYELREYPDGYVYLRSTPHEEKFRYVIFRDHQMHFVTNILEEAIDEFDLCTAPCDPCCGNF